MDVEMKFWDWLITINIDWENAVITCFSAFLGAWFAYRFNLRQQKKWDDERKKEEEKLCRANQIIQLNYLKTYLMNYLNQFITVYEILKEKQEKYNDIISKGYNILEDDKLLLRGVIVDVSYQMNSNKDSLIFTMDFPAFLTQLASVETNIKRFQSQIDFFNSRIKESVYNYQLTKNPTELVEPQKENIKPVFNLLYASVDSINIMLGVLTEYANKQGFVLNHNQEKPSERMVSLVKLSKMKMKACYEQKEL